MPIQLIKGSTISQQHQKRNFDIQPNITAMCAGEPTNYSGGIGVVGDGGRGVGSELFLSFFSFVFTGGQNKVSARSRKKIYLLLFLLLLEGGYVFVLRDKSHRNYTVLKSAINVGHRFCSRFPLAIYPTIASSDSVNWPGESLCRKLCL